MYKTKYIYNNEKISEMDRTILVHQRKASHITYLEDK